MAEYVIDWYVATFVARPNRCDLSWATTTSSGCSPGSCSTDSPVTSAATTSPCPGMATTTGVARCTLFFFSNV